MHSEWISFLQSQTAHIDSGKLHFSDSASEASATSNDTIIADLSGLGCIRITGEDAGEFLQGQFSNDVKLLDDTNSQLSSYCNPKGRMLAAFRLYRLDDTFYMLLPADTLDAALKRLRMFVLMSKVTLEDCSTDKICIGISGPNAESQLQQQFGDAPKQDNALLSCHGVELLRIAGPHARYILCGSLSDIQQTWLALAATCTSVGQMAWKLLDIEVGQPNIYASTVEAFIPQMVNLHAISGVSFSKGCYPGQEIVARMHYLGKLKRRMYRAHIETDTSPQPGDEIFSAASESGQGAGRIVEASPAAEGGYEVLAVVQIASAEGNDVHLQSATGPKLQFSDLPYEVPLVREK